MPIWLVKLLVYGHIGVLLEFWFTGLRSLSKRHWKFTASTYLWMPIVYGVTALLMEVIKTAVPWPFYLKAFLYLPLIYGAEALSGATLKLLTQLLQRFLGGLQGGTVPWEYEKSSWAPFGLVNFKYAPFWYFLAAAFDPLSHVIFRVVSAAGKL